MVEALAAADRAGLVRRSRGATLATPVGQGRAGADNYDGRMHPAQTSADAPPPRPPSRSGVVTVRPRYCECDPMGVVHHASYIPWLEMGRTELLRDSGLSYAQLEQRGVLLVIVKLDVRYRRSARYDDLLSLRTTVTGGSRIKLEHAYELTLTEPAGGWAAAGWASVPHEPPVLMVATTTLACVDRSGRPQPLPPWLVTTQDRSESLRAP